MKNEQELTVLISILPNIMQRIDDLVEDGALRYEAKQKANRMIKGIEHFTDYVLKGMEIDALKDLEQISGSFDKYMNEIFAD